MTKLSIRCLVCVTLVSIWSAITLAQKPELVMQTGHSFRIVAVAISPDGNTLASCSWDHTVKLWDLSTGAELRTLRDYDAISSIAFSPDGRSLASGGLGVNGKVKLWDVSTGAELRTLSGSQGAGSSVAFSPDGRMLASGGGNNEVKLWDVSTGTEFRTLKGHSNRVNSVAFSPDSKTLASGSADQTVKLWEIPTGKELLSLQGHSLAVNSVAFSPDGGTLASGSSDKTVKLWELATGTELLSLKGHSNRVNSVAFSPDGKTLASGSSDKTIKLWHLSTGIELRTFNISPGGPNVNDVAFSPHGKTLASADDFVVRVWDLSTGAELRTLNRHAQRAYSVAFSPDGKTLVAGGYGTVRLWDIAANTGLRSLDSIGAGSVAFSPDGKTFASYSGLSISGNAVIRLWDVSTGIKLRTLGDCSLPGVRAIAFSPDGGTLAGGCGDPLPARGKGVLRLWNLATGAELRTISTALAVDTMAFSPDGKTLAGGGLDVLKLWDVASGTELRTLSTSLFVNSVAFSPDGKTLASGGGGVKLWDVSTGTELRTFGHHPMLVTDSVSFGPDGKTLATGGSDHMIYLWEVSTGTELRSFKGHSGRVGSVTFSPNAKYLVSTSEDVTIRIWEIASTKELASLIAIDANDWVVTTPDGLFDGSPAAWSKIIWRFNNNTFSYAPIESFFGDFYYPGLLADIFAGNRPTAQTDIAQKDRRQPQVTLSLTSAQSDATLAARNVTVRIDIAQARAGAQDVRLFRNGSLVRVWHGDVLKGQSSATLEATVPIVAGENRLTAYAFNHDNIKSSDVSLVVNGADNLKRPGTLYLLAIGSNHYKSKGYDLNFALADVNEISKQVKAYQEQLGTYARTEVITLADEDATKANIMRALRRFADGSQATIPSGASPALKQQLEKIKTIEPVDGLVIYYAGHGTAFGEHFYLLPYDFSASNEAQLKRTSISDIELNEVLERVDAGKLVMVVDACQSGQALGGEKEGRGPMNSKGLAQLAYDKGMYILTAAQSYQAAKEVSRSLVGQKIEHGLLTFALLEGLTKARPDSQGRITEREWMNYAVDQVPLMQLEEMKKRSAEIKQRSGSGQRSVELVFDGVDNGAVDPEKRNVQRPRVFYRRELEDRPLIIAKQ